MRTRWTGTRTEGYCARGNHWLPLDHSNFYFSETRQDWISGCKPCNRARSRNRGGVRRPAANPLDRRFGVEMELTGPAPQTIVDAIRAAGVSVRYNAGYHATNNASSWELKTDGSVRGFGLELVSPPLQGADGFEQLRKVCYALQSVGATVDASCGLHVHHDMAGYTGRQIAKMALAFVERQDAFYQMVAPSRRTNHYSARWSEAHIDNLRRLASGVGPLNSSLLGIGPRGGVNLHAYPRHGTIEVRAHGGSTNFAKIAAWVRFGQAMLKAASVGANLGTDPRALLVSLAGYGLQAQDSTQLLRFVRAVEDAERVVEESDYQAVAV